MKKKIVLVSIVIVTAGIFAGAYFSMSKKPTLMPLEEDSPMALDGESMPENNIVLDDTSIELQKSTEDEGINKSDVIKSEKANGTGETAAFETPEDLAYEQQMAEENNYQMADVTITMYASSDCNVRSLPSTDGNILSNLKKGDKVTVSKVGDWYTIVLDDGKEGYVRGDLLTQEKVQAKEETAPPQEPTGESASTQDAPNTPTNQDTSGMANPNLTPEEMIRIAEAAGLTVGGAVTGEVTELHVDPNAAENSGVDLSGVTLH